MAVKKIFLIFSGIGYNVDMTIFTVDTSIEFPKTHFKTMDEFSIYMKQWEFERELDESITRAKLKNRSEYINI